MRKYGWLLLVWIALAACDLDFEDNKRLLVTGTIVDENSQPLQNVPITISATTLRGVLGGTAQEEFGEGRTDAAGHFQLVTLAPKGQRTINATINERFQVGFQENRARLALLGIETLETTDAALRLGTIRLERIVNARVTLKRDINSVDTLFYQIRTNPTEKKRYLDVSLSPEIFDDFFSPTDTLLPSQNEVTINLVSILAKDTVELRYRSNTGPLGQFLSQKLISDPQTNAYVFEF